MRDSPRRVGLGLAALLITCAGLGTVLVPAGAGPIEREQRRGEGTLLAWGKHKDYWPTRALLLLELGSYVHPVVAPVFVDAIGGREKRLHPYALKALMALEPGALRAVLSSDLIDKLVTHLRRSRNRRLQTAIRRVLGEAFPDLEAATPNEYAAWWRDLKPTYEPPAAPEPPKSSAKGATVAMPAVVRKAFDISKAGLEMAIVMDSTGSMQPAISATRDSVYSLVAILQGLTPQFRLGLVHYRDRGELGPKTGLENGADMLSRLTGNVKKVHERLAKLHASGGGDYPERVEAGLHAAYRSRMGWTRRANKVVVVVADAPPHPQMIQVAESMARLAFVAPEEALRARFNRIGDITPDVGRRDEGVRPFMTSCLLVGPGGARPQTINPMKRIAEAGGGVAIPLGYGQGPAAITALVTQLVELSFGPRFRTQVRRLVRTYVEWQEDGYFK
jgi:hypothetical protein